MNRKELKYFKKGLAIGLSRNKMKVSEIAEELEIPVCTIYLWLKENNEGKQAFNKSPGRPRKTSVRSNRRLARLAVSNNISSARQLIQFWQERVSRFTVYRRLRDAGIRKRRRAIVPFLSQANITARLQWCMARSHWRDIWSRVIFTDESRYRLAGNDGRLMVWRRAGARFHAGNVGHRLHTGGGSVHIWGAIWHGGRSDLIVLNAAVNQFSYIETLRHFFAGNLPNNFLFMDDNAPAHRAHRVANFLAEVNVRSLPWPARSPDLNPIEHVWSFISRQINQRPQPPANLQELQRWVMDEWIRVPQCYIDHLITDLPRRLRAVIEAHGRFTNY
jgi:transposase